jgi:serine/threonine-protein kinase
MDSGSTDDRARRPVGINQTVGGRYEILESLGEGPLLAAFRARDRQLNRIVALKLLRPPFDSNASLIELLREGISETLTLSHSAILRGYDVGIDAELGIPYYAEEFQRGIDLKERIRRTAPFQVNAAVDIAIVLAEALAFAHGRGLTHGDLRPQNVLIGADGMVKLTGFGVAAAQNAAAAADSSLLSRTVAYIAPDSASSPLPTATADIYALGVILFEMLTGEVPYKGDNAIQVALKHAQEPIPLPRAINQAVPRTVDGIVQKALAKSARDRYPSADALLADLRLVADALRFGRPLNWSPLETPELPPRAESNADTVRVMPTPVAAGRAMRKETARAVVPVPPARERVEEEEPMARTRSRGFPWLMTFNLLLLIIAACVIGYGVLQARGFVTPVDDVVIPNLVGQLEAEAKDRAASQKFKLVVVDRQYRDDRPAGTIYQQKEIVGNHIKQGKPISVWVSLGPQLVDVPDVTNVAEQKGQRLLEKAGLKIGTVTGEFDPITPRGNVLRQSPLPGDKQPRGARVDLVVSKGEEPLPTPEPVIERSPEPAASVPDIASDLKPRSFTVPLKPYVVPRDGQEHRIRIEVVDDTGTHTDYEQTHQPGDQVQVEVSGIGKRITIRLYDNDSLRGNAIK